MRLAIIGGRDFNDYDLLKRYASILTVKSPCPHIVIISGGAKGADSLAEKYTREHRYDSQIFLPDWKNEGKVAGFNRNQKIVNECDMVLAFWDGASHGTRDTIEKAKRAKKPTFIVYY